MYIKSSSGLLIKMAKVLVFVLIVFIVFISNNGAITQDYYWRDYVPGDIPYDAFLGSPVRYIGQVNYKSHNLVATIYPYIMTAVAELGGKQTFKENVKILCSPDNTRFYWNFVDFNKPKENCMEDVVKGGFQDDVILFIGKVFHVNEWKIGKVLPFESGNIKGLWVWNEENNPHHFSEFYILKYNLTVHGSYNTEC